MKIRTETIIVVEGLKAWCDAHGWDRSHVQRCIRGERPPSEKLRAALAADGIRLPPNRKRKAR